MNEICRENLIVYLYTIKKLTIKEIVSKIKLSKRKVRKILEDRNIKVEANYGLQDKLKLAHWLHWRKNFGIKESCKLANVSINAFRKYLKDNKLQRHHSNFTKLKDDKRQQMLLEYWQDKNYIPLNTFRIEERYKNIISTKMADEIIELFKNSKSIKEINKNIPCGINTIAKFLHYNNYELPMNGFYSRKYYCDNNAFNTIDTEEKAYWLGFIMGDGTLSKDGRSLTITLKSLDKSHLEKFLIFIKSDYPIREGTNKAKDREYKYCSVSINSKKLCQDLNKYGIVPNKTLISKYPVNLHNDLDCHFIRGLFDADGSIPLYKGFPRGFDICGTPELMKIVMNKLEIPEKYLYKREDLNNFASVRVNKREYYLKILNKIYKNATIYLDRKYERYMLICDKYKSVETIENHI